MKKVLFSLFVIIIALPAFAQNGSVISYRKLADSTANFTGVLGTGVNFGSGVAAIGDLNGNGVTELAVGAYDVGGVGAVYIMFMNSSGGIDSFKTITNGSGGIPAATISANNRFGYSVASIGDLDNDGVPDIAASSELDDDGGTDRGAVWILYMKTDGTVKGYAKINSTVQGSLLSTPAYGIGDLDRFGSEVAGIGDLDRDGIPDIAVSAIFDDDGGNNKGAVWIIFLNRNGSIKGFQKISDIQGGFTATMSTVAFWGSGLTCIGDLDLDGVQDLVVGQELENANGTYKGAAWVLFMNTNGTVKGYKELRNGLTGTGLPTLADNGYFGSACGAIGDVNGDTIPDVAVGANGTDSQRGAVWILMMNRDGTVKAYQKVSYNTGGSLPLDANDLFGNSVVSLGDINGDGKTDIAVGSAFDDDGGSDKGAVYILNLNGVPTSCVNAAFTTSNSTVCTGDSVTFSNTSTGLATRTYAWKVNGVAYATTTNIGYRFNTAGTYTIRLITSNTAPDCVDSVDLVVNVKASTRDTVTAIICQGQAYFAGGAYRTAAGFYNDTLTNTAGCDSIRVTNLAVLSIASVTTDTVAICQGDIYMGHSTAGIYSDTTQMNAQCTVDRLDLRVQPVSASSTAQTICNGDSILIGGLWRKLTGTYRDTLNNAAGCDSIITIALSIRPVYASSQNISICQGDTYLAGGANQTTAGTYRDTLTAVNGCDSVRTTILTVVQPIRTTIAATICFGDNYLGYTTGGTHTDTFNAANSCDSIRTLNLTIRPQNTSSITRSICQGQSFEGYTANGTYADTLSDANGCDSIRTLNLTVSNVTRDTVNETICFGDNYLGYNISGSYNDTFTLSGGCDSVRTLNLIIRPQIINTVNQFICAGQSFEGYTANGTYRDTMNALNGCDSIRILNLTVSTTLTASISQTICFGDTLLGYSATGVYNDTFVSSGGCDSIRTLNLTIRPQNASSISRTICQGESLDGYTIDGTYTDTLTAANGCDSIRILVLTVRLQLVSTESKDICEGESYLGHTISGVYNDTTAGTNGCDDVHILTLTVHANPVAPAILASGNVLSTPDTFATYQWYLNDTLLSQETNDTLLTGTNGNYAVVVSNGAGCKDTSATYMHTGVGVNELTEDLAISVYPNPGEGVFNINVSTITGGTFGAQVYNALGEKVWQQTISSGHTTFDLTHLAQGVYHLQVTTGNKTWSSRIIKQ